MSITYTRTAYKSLWILDPAPTAAGADLIQDNTVAIADRLEKAVTHTTGTLDLGDVTVSGDFSVGAELAVLGSLLVKPAASAIFQGAATFDQTVTVNANLVLNGTVSGLPDYVESVNGVSGSVVELNATQIPMTSALDSPTISARFGQLGSAADRNVGISSGNVPVLDANGKVATSVIPTIATTTNWLGTAANQSAMLTLRGEAGDWATRTDQSRDWVIITGDGSLLAHWRQLSQAGSDVTSVNGQQGSVVLTTSEITEGSRLYYTDARALSAVTWSTLTGKPSTFSPSTHTHTAADVSDSTAAGRSMLTAADAAAQRTLLQQPYRVVGSGTLSFDGSFTTNQSLFTVTWPTLTVGRTYIWELDITRGGSIAFFPRQGSWGAAYNVGSFASADGFSHPLRILVRAISTTSFRVMLQSGWGSSNDVLFTPTNNITTNAITIECFGGAAGTARFYGWRLMEVLAP